MAPAAAVLSKLEQNRQALKDTLTHLEQQLLDDATTPMDQAAASFLYGMVKSSHTDNLAIHKAILETNPANLADQQLEFGDLFTRVTRLMAGFAGINSRFVPAAAPPPPHGSAPQEIRLPKLELPTFDGNLQQWVSFHDLFTTAIHSKTKLSKCEKLTYLKSLLRGDAARLIQTLTVSDANYDIAWKKLIDRYQNERELVFTVFKRFLSQPIHQQPSSSGVRELLDVSIECVRSLEVFAIPLDKGLDAFLMYLLFSKLDEATKQLWEQQLIDTKLPSFQSLVDFLEQRARALAASGSSKPSTSGGRQSQLGDKPKVVTRASVHHTQTNCQVCCQPFHLLFKCPSFGALSVAARYDAVKKARVCFNCLNPGHSSGSCSSPRRCKNCSAKHHTLLCSQQQQQQSSQACPQPPAVVNHSQPQGMNQTILATALVKVVDGNGEEQLCRAMLDGGSTSSFITTSCVQRLRLQQTRSQVSVVGLSSTPIGNARGSTTLTFSPHFSASSSFSVEALVLPRITGKLPHYSCDTAAYGHLESLRLADPQFNVSSPVDLLLGSDIFWNLLLDGKIDGPPGTPVGINSHLGWLIAGQTSSSTSSALTFHVDAALESQLKKFWELEELPSSPASLTPEEQAAENHFVATHRRDDTGHYHVELPKKSEIFNLGESKAMALRRLKSLENRLHGNASEYHEDYSCFMEEYLRLGHMEEVPQEEILAPKRPVNYLPHHFVLKEDSTTTKFRVVFDASAKTTSGKSLNDCLLVGPVTQDNLTDIFTRFRCHQIAFTADIAKMYRQIRVSPEDADLQRILWREDPSKPVKEYRLLTVTYGTACAPFIATRVLKHLAETYKEELPLAYEAAMNDFYVDDIPSGTDTVEKGIAVTSELVELCRRGQLELRKWVSNSPQLIQSIPDDLREKIHRKSEEDSASLFSTLDQSVKCLGIRWNTAGDCFEFRVSPKITNVQSEQVDSKRSVASDAAKLFDPLGWIAPVVITAKILLQSLWKNEASWDSSISPTAQQLWNFFKSNLEHLSSLQVPRCIKRPNYCQIDLAGFSDASEKAYAAVVYLCVYFKEAPPLISIVMSKTRVAPAKQISLPRLELCGALLLAQLLSHVKSVLRLDVTRVRAWTDSTIVLAWINTPSHRLKTFVGNRVTKIQSLVHPSCWKHIPGTDNPADCASRGITPQKLVSHSLWWRGPSFLMEPPTEDPQEEINLSDEDQAALQKEVKQEVIVLAAVTCAPPTPPLMQILLEKFSSLRTLVRVIAWTRRFLKRKFFRTASQQFGSLQKKELDSALIVIIKFVQLSSFPEELKSINNGKPLSSKSKVLSLSPFIDNDGVLRVGGRLRHSSLPYHKKHPILLPRHSVLTDLLIRSKHIELLHAGPNLLQTVLQESFWIIRAKDAIRFHVRKCVVCRRQAAITFQPRMADLPSSRVTAGRPFLTCGVDYAGPFIIKSDAPRSKYRSKAYLCIFICMTTRAVHLELATSLSTDAFFAALKRFVARRNKPTTIFSDCGTNFVGAARELKEMLSLTQSSKFNDEMVDHTSSLGITWKFNPPSAPHFGGLWEAGVKSTKFHLKRVIGAAELTYEELSTLLTQVESCLNSRPLTAISSSPDDYSALTPGHFLTGASLQAVPEHDVMDLNTGRLNRWQILQQMQQQFWHRWSSEYITRLQQRPKWLQQKTAIEINDLVIVKDERFPPQKWKLGRVTSLHPGSDGVCRVVIIKTAEGEMKRPIVKLCLLPIDKPTTPTQCI